MKLKTSIGKFLTIGLIITGFFSACSPDITRKIQKTYSALDIPPKLNHKYKKDYKL